MIPNPKRISAPRSQPERSGLGRRIKLTQEVYETIITTLEEGNFFCTACQIAGVTERTCYNWMRRGEELNTRYPEDDPTDAEELLFLSFYVAVKRAKAVAISNAVANIIKAGDRDWRASAWFLERTCPEDWSDVSKYHHKISKMSDDELYQHAKELLGDKGMDNNE
jgi:hypothetical protein